MGKPDHFTCLLRNLYASQEATIRTRHGTTDWFKIGKGLWQGCILSLCLFNFYAEYIMWNAGLDEWQAEIKTAGKNINLRYADDTTLMAEAEEELPCGSDGEETSCNVGDPGSIPGSGRSPGEGKWQPTSYSCLENARDEEPGRLQSIGSLRVRHDWATSAALHWRRTKEPPDEDERKHSENKDHGIWSHRFMAIAGKKVETVTDFIFLGSKITVDSDFNHEMKRCLPLGRKLWPT